MSANGITKENAGKCGPAIHRQETAADERRAEEAVLPVGGVDEHSGKGEERHRVERRQIEAQDAIERVTGHRQPAGERPEIGRERQRQGDQERGRRIEERRIADLRTEQRLLRRPMRADVVGELRTPVER
jgi:hypothetical protein